MKNILRARVAIIGDCTVGKTAAIQMYMTDGKDFPKSYEMTMGVTLSTKTIFIPDTNDAVELYLYDSSGQNFYADFIGKYWNQPNMYIIYYDVTSQPSFDAVPKWADLVKSNISRSTGTGQKPPGVLFANKTDLVERRVISSEEGRELASKLDMQYFEGSAKENKNLAEPFDWLGGEWHKTFMEKIEAFNRMS